MTTTTFRPDRPSDRAPPADAARPGRPSNDAPPADAARPAAARPATARAVGWLCLASAAAMLAAPLPVGRLLGLPARRGLLRALALRDVAVGAGLVGPRPRPWLAARAASDTFDAALIVAEARRGGRSPAATVARVAVALGSAAVAARAFRAG